jgi:C4-dicarboxylate transporter, DctQ subunit
MAAPQTSSDFKNSNRGLIVQKLLRSMAKASAVFDFILGALVYVAAAILAFITLAVCWDVIARATAAKPLPWVLEFTEYGLLYMTFLCAAWVLRKEGHVTSDLLISSLSKKTQIVMNTVTSMMGGVVCLILTWFGTAVSLEKLRMGSYQPTAMEPPDFPIFIIIPIGTFLLFIQFMRRAWIHRTSLKEHRTENSEERV